MLKAVKIDRRIIIIAQSPGRNPIIKRADNKKHTSSKE